MLVHLALVGVTWTVVLGVGVLLVVLVAARLAPAHPQASQFVLIGGLLALLVVVVATATASLAGVVLPPWRARASAAALHDDVQRRVRFYRARLRAHYHGRHARAGVVDAEVVRRKVYAAANLDARLLEQRRAWHARLAAIGTLLFAAALLTIILKVGKGFGLTELLQGAPMPWPLDLLPRLPSWPWALPVLVFGEALMLIGSDAQRELWCREHVAHFVADEHTP